MKKILIILCLIIPLALLSATTIEEVEKTCALCKKTSTQIDVMSTNTMGSPDLDLRPAEMQRSTIIYWVEECPHCGYCNSDIGEYVEGAEKIVTTKEYRARLENTDYPHLADQFLCMMMINEAAGEVRSAIYNCICASWACDDAENEEAAKECRLLALDRLEKFRKDGGDYMEQAGGDFILLCEFARRAGNFATAKTYAEQGIAAKPEKIIVQILEYELKLIAKKDTAAHTVDEALG